MTSHDFLDPLLHRLSLERYLSASRVPEVRRQAQTFIVMCSTGQYTVRRCRRHLTMIMVRTVFFERKNARQQSTLRISEAKKEVWGLIDAPIARGMLVYHFRRGSGRGLTGLCSRSVPDVAASLWKPDQPGGGATCGHLLPTYLSTCQRRL